MRSLHGISVHDQPKEKQAKESQSTDCCSVAVLKCIAEESLSDR